MEEPKIKKKSLSSVFMYFLCTKKREKKKKKKYKEKTLWRDLN